jgi:hypothetical protein
MTDTILTCEDVQREALIERSLAGRLTGAERDAFEVHYLTCSRCQTELQLGAAVRVALRSSSAANPSRAWPRWAGIAGLAAAGVFAMVVWRTQSGTPPELQRLGAVVQAPIYLGVPLRSTDETAVTRAFDDAMRAYQAEEFGDAARRLRQVTRDDSLHAPAEFFLGASLLMSGDDANAANAFARVIALGDTPYLSEAHYYRAKALLRRGEAAPALRDLYAVDARSEVIAAQARAKPIHRFCRRITTTSRGNANWSAAACFQCARSTGRLRPRAEARAIAVLLSWPRRPRVTRPPRSGIC